MDCRKFLILTLLLVFAVPAHAQHHSHEEREYIIPPSTFNPPPKQAESAGRRRPGTKGIRYRQGARPIEKYKPTEPIPSLDVRRSEIIDGSLSVTPSSQEFFPVRNRWNMLYQGKWYDPYNQNILKGDLPVFGEPGHEWFLELTVLSDTMFEYRNLPTPVGLSSTLTAESTDVFGRDDQMLFTETLLTQIALIRGNTVFKPPEFEIRIAPIFNVNHFDSDELGVVRVDPSRGSHRDETRLSFQELFIDYHLADVTDRYDFISFRAGIQRFNADFKGFVFIDDAPGVRLFGTMDNNKYQWNAAWFNRLEKDINFPLNKIFDDRHEQVVVANIYRQDLFALGHQVQGVFIHREDRAGDEGFNYDENGFLNRPASIGDERPKNISSSYLGFNTDGHFDRLNVNTSFYHAFGSESHNPIAGRRTSIDAFMAAAELSIDFNWYRVRSSVFWASGDDDPFDSSAEGFDAIFDNPNFLGGDTSFWQRQGIPLVAGGGVALVNRFSLIPSLRAGKEQGQSNFVHPGVRIFNVGLDIEATPKTKIISNLNWMEFDDTSVLETVRQDGFISREIGLDISTGILYRPFLNNNIQFRLGAAALVPGDGLKNLYGNKTFYQAFSNLILLY